MFEPPAHAQGPLERAREELGIERPLPGRWPLPQGDLEVSPAELIGAGPVRFTVRLARPAPGVVRIGLPGTRPGRSGLPGLRGPAELVIRLDGDDLEESATVEHVGLPAGTYALPLRDGAGRSLGTARLRVLAPAREGPPAPWRGTDVSLDDFPQSEAFATVVPGDPRRMAVAANPGAFEPTMSAWLSGDGGDTWARHPLPETLDVPGTAVPEPNDVCCDPMFAATPQGDIWFGGITHAEGPPGARSRIVVNRLTPGRDGFAPLSVGLPARTAGLQDKPMITAAPDGRLLVVWLEPDATEAGALNLVLSGCHTGLGPEEDPGAWCEDADHWTAPVDVTPAPGSYTYPDVAAAPNGAVHVTWWDFSSMENGVRGATCAAPCLGSFAAPRTVALLDATGGRPLPFGCPIPVAPGGRVGAAPAVEAAPDGRVWVAWGDLRPGSGTTRCEETAGGGYTAPRPTHLSWDAFAASAAGGLPGGERPSAEAGTRLLTDGDEGAATTSDDFLPALAADPVSGEVWGAAYTTGHDAERRSTHYVAVSLAPGRAGPANRVSEAPSSFANEPCCTFANDFGDYAGLAATDRVVVPAWIDNASGESDLWAAAGRLATVGFDLVDVEAAAGDGATVLVRPAIVNTGTRTAAAPTASLAGAPGRVVFPDLAPGERAVAPEPFALPVTDCASPAAATLTVASPEGSEALALNVPATCPPPAQPAPTIPATPGPAAPPPPAAAVARLSVPRQRLATVLRRGLLVAVRCTRACRASVTADLGPSFARRLALRRRMAFAAATFGTRTRRVRLPVRARARRLLARRSAIRLRVRAFSGRSHRTRRVTIRR